MFPLEHHASAVMKVAGVSVLDRAGSGPEVPLRGVHSEVLRTWEPCHVSREGAAAAASVVDVGQSPPCTRTSHVPFMGLPRLPRSSRGQWRHSSVLVTEEGEWEDETRPALLIIAVGFHQPC